MMEWMQKAETLLDADTSVSNDHATIKAQITKHRVRLSITFKDLTNIYV